MARSDRRRSKPFLTHLRMERLEPRDVPAVITVTNLLDDGSAGSLRWAVDQANATAGDDSVVFDPALSAGGATTVTLSMGQLTLTDTSGVTTIDGGGVVTVDGNNASRVFLVNTGVTATLAGLTVTHGAASDGGGGVSNAGTLTLTQCTVTSNIATDNPASGFIAYGGGVYNVGALTLDQCTITGNTSSGNVAEGGGVANVGTLTATQSTISFNGTFTSGNTAEGGGVYNVGTLALDQCTITNNTASGNGSGYIAQGGGVFNANPGTLTLTQCIVVSNRTSGGIDVGGGVYNSGSLTVTQSSIASNTASTGGGAFNGGTMTVIQSGITSNGALTGGGVANSGALTVTQSTISNNGGTTGGGMYNTGSLTVSQSTIASNSSTTGGGVDNSGSLTLDHVTVTDNSAFFSLQTDFFSEIVGSGGGVNNSGTLTAVQSTIANNRAVDSGGGVNNSGTLTISQSTIANNRTTGGFVRTGFGGSGTTTYSSGDGGGVYNTGVATIIQSTVASNTAIQLTLSHGGGVFNSGTLAVTQSTIVNNRADVDGGGVSNGSGTFILANTLVVGNIAPTSAELSGTFVDNGGNLVGVPVGFTLGQVVQVDGGGVPLLADNGGPTQTVALADHSPAQNVGSNATAGAFTTDQRGFLRIASAHVDVGAVETESLPLPLAVAIGTEVKVTDATSGAVITTLHPFPGFGGSVSAVVADFTGDGVADYAVGAGAGGGPHIKVFDGVSGAEVASFFAFAPTFTGGVSLAAGDVTGDGVADLVVGAGAGGGPHVKVFSGPTFAEVWSFFAFDASFAGGVSVAAGDLDGDGNAEVIAGAGAGGGPHVKAFDFRTGAVVRSFFAYDPAFSGGVNVAAGDLDGDGKAEIITGAGPGGSPHVKAFTTGDVVVSSFFAYDPAFSGGVRVGVRDVNRDGFADIVTGAGPGGGPHVKAFDGRTGTELESYFADAPDDHGGVFVG